MKTVTASSRPWPAQLRATERQHIPAEGRRAVPMALARWRQESFANRPDPCQIAVDMQAVRCLTGGRG